LILDLRITIYGLLGFYLIIATFTSMKLKDLALSFKNKLGALYAEDEAQALFLTAIYHYLKFSRADYLLKKETEVADQDLYPIETLLQQLQTGIPIQYLVGESQFYGLTFKVNPSVLIPRPETEELVEWVLEKVCSSQFSVGTQLPTPIPIAIGTQLITILDIGTGSGCIAISLKKNLPKASVSALDISAQSILTAKENAVLNNVEVEFIEQDILAVQHALRHTPYAIIVSNPPYIKEDEKEQMHQNVLANEPHTALFVSNENPLIFYNAIANFALKNLKSKGLLFFEINEYLGKETVDMLKHKGFINIELKKDMQGKDRMVCCEINLNTL
jgi:release factor glutamine methyltransferase